MTAASVFVYTSEEVGAPVLNGQAGSLIALLKSIGITGFNAGACTISVSGGVATVSRGGHGFSPIDVGMKVAVQIAGATPSALNGKQACTIASASTFTFDAPGVPDGAASGSITCRRAPFGLRVATEAGNVCIFDRADPLARPFGLRVDHSSDGAPLVRSIETWTDVNTYTGSAPTSGATWAIQNSVAATPVQWCCVADSRMFYLFAEGPGYTYTATASPAYQSSVMWGDLVPLNAADLYATIISNNPYALATYLHGSGGGTFTTQRAPSQLGTPVLGNLVAVTTTSSGANPLAATTVGLPAYPSIIDGGFAIAYPVPAVSGGSVRGTMPGLAEPIAGVGSSLQRKRVPGVSGVARDFIAIGYTHATTNFTGCALFDITGPWR